MPLGHAHADSRVSGVVQVAEHLGAESFVYMDVDVTTHRQGESDIDVATGQEYSVGIPAEACYLFDAKEQAFRARPTYPRLRGESARFSFLYVQCLLPVARPVFYLLRHRSPGSGQRGAGRNPSLPVLV